LNTEIEHARWFAQPGQMIAEVGRKKAHSTEFLSESSSLLRVDLGGVCTIQHEKLDYS